MNRRIRQHLHQYRKCLRIICAVCSLPGISKAVPHLQKAPSTLSNDNPIISEGIILGTTYWEAAWTWSYLGCWAAVDLIHHGPGGAQRRTAEDLFHTMLTNMAQVCSTGRKHVCLTKRTLHL